MRRLGSAGRISRKTPMTNSLKFFVVLALGVALAAPAFAQQAPHARRDAYDDAAAAYAAGVAAQRQGQRQWQNNNLNPDFQLGGDR
jgi:hypothetical protein